MTGLSLPEWPGRARVEAWSLRGAARWIAEHRAEIAVVALLFAVAVAHGYNMLHYPYVEDDEGTYLSQAWAVFHLGKLAPSTYIYDHPPLGWIQIAVWQLLTSAAHFGSSVTSGRMLMLLFQLGTVMMVFAIGHRTSGKLWVGLLAAALASLLPFGMQYQRRILLDNVCTFWLVASILALSGRLTLRRVWFSAIALSIAILSKEIAVAALPAIALLVARRSSPENRMFALAGWLALTLSICSTYLLMALLKGEMFPAGTALGGSHPHVSLLCTVMWQAGRASDGGILQSTSSFWTAFNGWVRAEPLLVIGGLVSVAYLLTARRRHTFASTLGVVVICMFLFLGRGGVVQTFYLVPLLPLLALCVAFTLDGIVRSVRTWTAFPRTAAAIVGAIGLAGVGVGAGVAYAHSGTALWSADPIKGQDQALSWVEQNLPRNTRLVIDNYMWVNLHEGSRGSTFPHALYYWDVGYDPRIRRQIFGDSWRNVDYVITTPQVIHDLRAQTFPVVSLAVQHSVLVKRFDTGSWAVDIRRVDPRVNVPLSSWRPPTVSEPSCMTYS